MSTRTPLGGGSDGDGGGGTNCGGKAVAGSTGSAVACKGKLVGRASSEGCYSTGM